MAGFNVAYEVREDQRTRPGYSTAPAPIKDIVQIADAEGRFDAIAQAALSLNEAGFRVGMGEEIVFRVEPR